MDGGVELVMLEVDGGGGKVAAFGSQGEGGSVAADSERMREGEGNEGRVAQADRRGESPEGTGAARGVLMAANEDLMAAERGVKREGQGYGRKSEKEKADL